MRTTHTFATLPLSESAYREIEKALRAAGYDHAFVDGAIDMHGIGVTLAVGAVEPTPQDAKNIAERLLIVRSRLIGEGYTQGCGIELNAIADELRRLPAPATATPAAGHESWVSVWHAPGAPNWEAWSGEAIANYFFDEGTRYAPRNPRNMPAVNVDELALEIEEGNPLMFSSHRPVSAIHKELCAIITRHFARAKGEAV